MYLRVRCPASALFADRTSFVPFCFLRHLTSLCSLAAQLRTPKTIYESGVKGVKKIGKKIKYIGKDKKSASAKTPDESSRI